MLSMLHNDISKRSYKLSKVIRKDLESGLAFVKMTYITLLVGHDTIRSPVCHTVCLQNIMHKPNVFYVSISKLFVFKWTVTENICSVCIQMYVISVWSFDAFLPKDVKFISLNVFNRIKNM